MRVGLFVFLAVTIATTLITFMLPPSYKASARIMLLAAPLSATPGQPLQTEMEIIQSQPVLGRVIERLKLSERWGARYNDRRTLQEVETIGLLKARIELEPVRNTTILNISIFGERPDETAELANAIAE